MVSKIKIEYANRVSKLPKYVFAAIEDLKKQKEKEGLDLISLGIGDPDLPTPEIIINEIIKHISIPENQNYPLSMGEQDYREAVARWNRIRYGINLDPDTEVSHVIGGKEGVANVARAFVNHGEIVLCPSPGYPVYEYGATKLCDGKPILMPLKKDNGFLPNFDAIDTKILKKAKLMYLNYPNNPTGAIAPENFLRKAVDLAEDYNFIIIYDNPYSEFTFGEYIAPSILQFSLDHVEINSASKMFNMTGFRCGWIAGNAEVIQGLRKIKSQIDSGGPIFIQKGVIKALNQYQSSHKPEIVAKTMAIYEKRRDVLVNGLNEIGWNTERPKATFYVWTQIPEAEDKSMDFIKRLISHGVIATPGIGFGIHGEGFIRFALTQPIEKINQALERIKKVIK